MNITKTLLPIVIGLCTLPVYPITLPSIRPLRPLISRLSQIAGHLKTSIARSSKTVVNAIRRHKIISAAAITTVAVIATPQTRRPIAHKIRSCAASICKRIGLLFGSPAFVRLSTRLGAHYNDIDPTVLHHIINGNYLNDQWVYALIDAHVNVNARFYGNSTLLHTAARGYRNDGIVRALIAAGADIEAQDDMHSTPLHEAALNGCPESVRALIKAGANIHAQNDRHETPLHEAAMNGHPVSIRALLEAGAHIDAQDALQETPLHLAAASGRLELVRDL